MEDYTTAKMDVMAIKCPYCHQTTDPLTIRIPGRTTNKDEDILLLVKCVQCMKGMTYLLTPYKEIDILSDSGVTI